MPEFIRKYTTVDKSTWGEGPWQMEADKLQWIDAATDLDCLIVRNPRGGNLCGYVGVPPTHPWHGKGYSSCIEGCSGDECGYEHSPGCRIDVHGGLTFAAACAEGAAESEGICHVPQPGRSDHVWWFGFDCAHYMDVSPGYAGLGLRSFSEGTYRDAAYVVAQVEQLAKQLRAVTGEVPVGS